MGRGAGWRYRSMRIYHPAREIAGLPGWLTDYPLAFLPACQLASLLAAPPTSVPRMLLNIFATRTWQG